MTVMNVWRKLQDRQRIVLVDPVSEEFHFSGRAEDIPVKFLNMYVEEIYCANNILFLKVSD